MRFVDFHGHLRKPGNLDEELTKETMNFIHFSGKIAHRSCFRPIAMRFLFLIARAYHELPRMISGAQRFMRSFSIYTFATAAYLIN